MLHKKLGEIQAFFGQIDEAKKYPGGVFLETRLVFDCMQSKTSRVSRNTPPGYFFASSICPKKAWISPNFLCNIET